MNGRGSLLIALYFAVVTCSVALVIAIWTICFGDDGKFSLRREAIEKAQSGTIVKLAYEDVGLFVSDKEYRIYISVPYEYDGKTYNTEKYFTVSEDEWKKYSVGDTFVEAEEK